MSRRIAVPIALLVAWACYGLLAISVAGRQAGRCHDLGALAAACARPALLFLAGLSFLFLCATVVLAFLALRSPSNPDKN